jgi:hypothetical protein
MYISYKKETAQVVVNSLYPMLFIEKDTARMNLLAKLATISLSFD